MTDDMTLPERRAIEKTAKLGGLPAFPTCVTGGWVWYCDYDDNHGTADTEAEADALRDAHIEYHDALNRREEDDFTEEDFADLRAEHLGATVVLTGESWSTGGVVRWVTTEGARRGKD